MSKPRPTPRRSALSDMNPVNPPQPAPREAPPQTTDSPVERATPAKSKVGFYQHVEDTARARGAFIATQSREDYGSFSEFIAAAVMKETQRLEQQYNGGAHFPPRAARPHSQS